jgi:hypothetical protein
MTTFQMEFHLPFFALRKAPPSNSSPIKTREKALRGWVELTLLTRDKTESEGQENYRLHKAQMSCVVHGFDEWQWVAHTFEDTKHEYEDDGNPVGDGELNSNEVAFCQNINEDPITCILEPI